MFPRASKLKVEATRPFLQYNSRYLMHILAECDDFIAVDKPFGMFSQGGTNVHSNNNIIEVITKHYFTKQVLSVHRLDRDTSGVVIFAKTKEMAQHLSHQFISGHIKKVYHAITLCIPSTLEGIIDEPLAQVKHGSMMRVCVNRDTGKQAKTHFQVKQSNLTNQLALLELKPSTGRKHQLRVHCAFMNCPILGDVKYGGLVLNNQLQRKFLQDFGVIVDSRCRLMLHASSLSFVDRKGGEHVIRAELPNEFSLLTRNMTSY